VVFDEVEKAHTEAHNMLLQIMEEGHLSDARGRTVDFRNAIIVMTSNVGAEMIKRQSSLGFALERDEEVEERVAYEEMRKKLMEALRKVFRPEFLNRVDAIIVFHALTRDQIAQIVDLELQKVADRLVGHAIDLRLTDAARALLAELGYDPDMGARPLRRAIQNKIEDQLSDRLLSGDFASGDLVIIDEQDGEVVLRSESREPTDEAQEALPAG
jgi:ATP-dependent Clp protease ATP-binding subunit ClpC